MAQPEEGKFDQTAALLRTDDTGWRRKSSADSRPGTGGPYYPLGTRCEDQIPPKTHE